MNFSGAGAAIALSVHPKHDTECRGAVRASKIQYW